MSGGPKRRRAAAIAEPLTSCEREGHANDGGHLLAQPGLAKRGGSDHALFFLVLSVRQESVTQSSAPDCWLPMSILDVYGDQIVDATVKLAIKLPQ